MNIKNKTVMITGGSSGIGLQTAKSFSSAGAKVLICARPGPELDQVKKENPWFEVYECDLSKSSDVIELLTKAGPKTDICINNAGIFQQYKFINPDKSFERLQAELNINFVASAMAITNLVPFYQLKPKAIILTITSGMGYVPKALFPMYSASKAALHSFLLSARNQLKGTNIKIIEVVPQQVATRLTEGVKGNKVSTEVIADAVIKAIQMEKETVLIGESKKLVFLSRFFPAYILKKMNTSQA